MSDVSLAALRERSKVTIDSKFSLRSYINSAAKIRESAEKADRDGDVPAAYVGYKKMGNLVRALLDHPEFKALHAAKSSEYYTFTDLKARVITASHRAKELEQQLEAERSSRNNATNMPSSSSGSSINGQVPASVESIASLALDPASPSTSSTGYASNQAPISKTLPPPIPSASSKPAFPSANASPTTPTSPHRPARISNSLAARMAALYNAGMEGAGDHSSGGTPTSSKAGVSPQSASSPLPSAAEEAESTDSQSNGIETTAGSSLKRSPAVHTSKPAQWRPPQLNLRDGGDTASTSQHNDFISSARSFSPPHVDDPNTETGRPDSAPPTLPHATLQASGPATSGQDLVTEDKTGGSSSSGSASRRQYNSGGDASSQYPRRPTLSARTSENALKGSANGDIESRLAALQPPADLDDFANRFPDVDQEGFEILPSAPTFRPGDKNQFEKGGIPRPFHPAPQSSNSPALPNGTGRRGSTSSVGTNTTGGSGKGVIVNGLTHSQLHQAAASKPPPPAPGTKPARPPLPPTPNTPSLPNLNSTSISPKELWSFLDPALSSGPNVLLIDVRNRKAFSNGHIKGKAVCIEPFTLSSNSSSFSIENTLIVSPDHERDNFAKRATFDLIVIYNQHTRSLPPKSGASNGSASRNLYNGVIGSPTMIPGSNGTDPSANTPEAKTLAVLFSAIYEFNFSDERNRLKRSPLLLVGGYDAWAKEVGEKGIQTEAMPERKFEHHSPQLQRQPSSPPLGSKESEYQAMLNNRGILQPSQAAPSASQAETKRQHRKAVISGDGTAPSLPPRDGPPSYNGISSPSSASQGTYSPYTAAHPPIAVPPVAVHRTGPASPYEAYPSTPLRGPMYGNGGQQRQVSGEYFDPYTSAAVSNYGMATQYPGPGGFQTGRPIDYPNLQQRQRIVDGSPTQHGQSIQGPHIPSGNVQVPQPVLARAPSSAMPDGAQTPSLQLLQSASYLSSPAFGAFPKQLTALGDGSVGLTGLKNLGNTCYMNSMVQCMSATIPLARFLKEGSYKRAINTQNPLGTKGVLADAVAQLVQTLWSERYSFLAPVTFRDAICHFQPRFKGSDQHDSQEFLSFLLDGLHEDLNLVLKKPLPVEYTPEREAELEALPTQIAAEREWNIYLRRDDSIIVRLLQGQYKSQLRCLTCGTTSTTYNTFMYLSLPVPSGRNIGKVTLNDCINMLTRPETLEGGDAWNCSKCKKPRSATKTLTIARLPPVLLIHLKRFSFQGPFTDKIDTQVVFPVRQLDMTSFLPTPLDPAVEAKYAKAVGGKALEKTSPVYDLHAVSNHFGSLSSGHYTAYVRSRGTWHDLNDSKINRIQEAQVAAATKSCYTLWYTRRG